MRRAVILHKIIQIHKKPFMNRKNHTAVLTGIAVFICLSDKPCHFLITAFSIIAFRCRSPPFSVLVPQKTKMEERRMGKHFFLRIDGERIPVSEEVYRAHQKMKRRELYLEERDAAHGKISYNAMDTDEMLGEDAIPDTTVKSVEQTVIDKMMSDALHHCLDRLPADERELIDALFFSGITEREYAAVSGIPQRTINSRKACIFGKLKKYLGD